MSIRGKEKTDKNNKKIKKFLILVIVFAVTIGLVLYLCELYKVYESYQKETPVIRDYLQEITSNDLKPYIQENPSSLIYMCTSSDDVCRSFEKDLKKLVSKDELGNEIIYLNLSDVNSLEFVNDFNSSYSYKEDLTTNYPAFVLFEEGKIVKILQGNKEKPLTITRVKHFLELNEIGE